MDERGNEKIEDLIKYTEYLSENLNKTIEYTEYLSENFNKAIEYIEFLENNDYLTFREYKKLN